VLIQRTEPIYLRQQEAGKRKQNAAAAAKLQSWAAVPASLSLVRFVFACVFPIAGRIAGVALVLAAAISDGLDGFLARRWNVTTVWGSMIDALSDKVFLWAALGTLVARGELAVWVLMLLLVRDVVAVSAALAGLLTSAWGIVEEFDHATIGRLTTLALFALVITRLGVPGAAALNNVVAGVAIVLSFAAGVTYLARIRALTGAKISREPEIELERR
jgi:phosphatidylglycerophosphate synthase